MTDRRITPDAARVSEQTDAQICEALVDLRAAPDGARDRQLLLGEPVTILGRTGAWAYVRAEKDGYHGFVPGSACAARDTATHRVCALATHAYSKPDLKSPERLHLSFASRLTALRETGGYIETALGFVPAQHLAPAGRRADHPAEVAALFNHVPYLWGGNSAWGIDCSGLVQAALLAAGIPCPGDTDLQLEAFAAADPARLQRGDLVFWKGHVGMLLDPDTLIHANAHHMAVATEPLEQALARIARKEFGEVTGYRRP